MKLLKNLSHPNIVVSGWKIVYILDTLYLTARLQLFDLLPVVCEEVPWDSP